jgi:N-acetylglucosamine-6-sulfatase
MTPPRRTWRRRALAAGALVFASATLVGIATGSGGAAAQGGGDPRPNVVMIMTDDQDTASVKVMKAVERKLARRGTTFKKSFATFPLCCPSRATSLTGQYAHHHGVMGARDFADFDDSDSMPVALRRSGYRTAFIGKYLNGYSKFGKANPKFKPPGWTRWYADLTPGRMFDWVLNDNGRPQKFRSRPRDYKTDVLAREATQFIRRTTHRKKPFFVAVTPLAPHGEPAVVGSPNPRPAPRDEGTFRREPFPKPPSFNERNVSDKPSFVRRLPRLDPDQRQFLRLRYRSRLESLLAVDHLVAKLVGVLKQEDQLRDTYILFTSDNGFLLGEHRLTGKTKLYEPSVRVPLILRGPGIPHDAVRRQITGNIDVTPTILDATGVSPLDEVDGISLLPLADDRRVAAGRDILLENRLSAGVRTRDYMYAEHSRKQGPDEFELYDLEADPDQLRNRYGDRGFGSITNQLKQRVDELRDCAGASCR